MPLQYHLAFQSRKQLLPPAKLEFTDAHTQCVPDWVCTGIQITSLSLLFIYFLIKTLLVVAISIHVEPTWTHFSDHSISAVRVVLVSDLSKNRLSQVTYCLTLPIQSNKEVLLLFNLWLYSFKQPFTSAKINKQAFFSYLQLLVTSAPLHRPRSTMPLNKLWTPTFSVLKPDRRLSSMLIGLMQPTMEIKLTQSTHFRDLYNAATKTPVHAMRQLDRWRRDGHRSSKFFVCTPVLGAKRRKIRRKSNIDIETRMVIICLIAHL